MKGFEMLLKQVLSSLGINAEEIMNARNRANGILQHFDQKLSRIEANQAKIMRALNIEETPQQLSIVESAEERKVA